MRAPEPSAPPGDRLLPRVAGVLAAAGVLAVVPALLLGRGAAPAEAPGAHAAPAPTEVAADGTRTAPAGSRQVPLAVAAEGDGGGGGHPGDGGRRQPDVAVDEVIGGHEVTLVPVEPGTWQVHLLAEEAERTPTVGAPAELVVDLTPVRSAV